MRLPQKVKKVFQGKIFSVHQWRQKLYDGSTAVFEMLKRPDTVQVIAVKDGQILLAREEQPTKKVSFGFFGGRVEPKESPLAAARREFLEETGMAAKRWQLFRVYEPLHKMEWKVFVFVAHDCRQIEKPRLDPGEKIRVIPVDFAKFIRVVESDKFWARELQAEVLRLHLAGKLQSLKKLLFPQPDKSKRRKNP